MNIKFAKLFKKAPNGEVEKAMGCREPESLVLLHPEDFRSQKVGGCFQCQVSLSFALPVRLFALELCVPESLELS